MVKCPFCEPIEHKTRWYYEDELIAVFDCVVHKQPMIVLKRHTSKPTAEEMAYMRRKAKELFGEKVRFRGYMGSIKSHFHDHLII